MAEKSSFPSVHQFAVEILRGNSTQRLAWLRQYYTSLNHPDLANTVTKNFPQPDSAQTSSTSTKPATKSHTHTRTPQKDVPKAKRRSKYTPETPQTNVPVPQTKPRHPQNDVLSPQKKQKIPQKKVLDPLSEELEEQETVCSARGHKRTKRGSVSSSGAFRAGGGLGLDQASSSGLGSREAAAAAFLNRTDRDTPSSPDLSHSRSTTLSKPTAQGCEREEESSSRPGETFQKRQTPSLPEQAAPTSSRRSLLTDLIGDTSILDDLLKPKARGAKQRGSPKTPPLLSSSPCINTPSPSRITLNTDSGSADSLNSNKPSTTQVVSKGSRKDFWDILNEGNEESINRLTDPAEVQRVCINTKFAARGAGRSGEESKSLWKTNDKFLWKK